jgi:hypothetical protein
MVNNCENEGVAACVCMYMCLTKKPNNYNNINNYSVVTTDCAHKE